MKSLVLSVTQVPYRSERQQQQLKHNWIENASYTDRI